MCRMMSYFGLFLECMGSKRWRKCLLREKEVQVHHMAGHSLFIRINTADL